MTRSTTHCTALIVTALFAATAAASSSEPVNIDTRRELFTDDYLIARTTGDIQLRLHSPAPQEVSLVHDKPWEGNTSGYHTMFRDGDICRMYYRGWGHDAQRSRQLHPAVVCYAESPDGIGWTRPDLNLVEFDGSKHNNIILAGFGTHNFTPFKDTNPDCAPAALYKAVARGEGKDNQNLFAFGSPDGIHWQRSGEQPIITEGAFDSQNLAFWDTVTRQYRCYFRDFKKGFRDIKTATSPDFVHWTKPQWLDYGDAGAEHLYTNQIQPYYRAPHIYIGFPTRYIPERASLTEGLFMTSRDGVHFNRFKEALLRPGPNQDKWHNRSNYIWLGIIETESALGGAGNEMSIYSNEGYYKGQAAVTRRYTFRLDGFVSLRASYDGGEVTTKALIFQGDTLTLNLATSAAGAVQVEIQDKDGNPIEGYTLADCRPIYGDYIDHPVKWKTPDVSVLGGKPIRLRFVLKDADLYALQFTTTRQ